MVQFHYKRNFVSILTGNSPQNTESRSNGITSAFNGQFYNIFRVKIDGIRSERSSGCMLNILVDRKNGHISRICQTTMSQQSLQAAQGLYVTVRVDPYLIDRIR